MRIQQKIQRVFLLISGLMLLVGAGNVLVMVLGQMRSREAIRETAVVERTAARVEVRMEKLRMALDDGSDEELEELMGMLLKDVGALVEGVADVRAQSFRRKVLGYRDELPELQAGERLEGFEDLAMQAEVVLDLRRGAIEGVTKETGIMFIGFQGVAALFVMSGMGFCLAAGGRFSRHFAGRLEAVNGLATALASGDLTQRLDWEAEEEFLALSDSLNRLVHNLSLADAEISREVQERMFAEKKALDAARAKSAFLAHMSHEFRTPLNGILGYTQVLLMDQGLSDKNKQVVNSLKRSGESLLELINDVLDLSKIEARSMKVQMTRFYLMDMLESLKESYADQVRNKGLEFYVETGEDVPEDVLSDAIRLRQILVNLIGNAFKFTDTGSITLRVRTVEGGLRFEVEDTGIGIAPEDLEKIFQPFVQVETTGARRNKGTGLGLSISNSLLEMMKSQLQVESVVGRGTTFWFVLPQPEREGRRLVLPARKVSGYEGKVRRLMLVDPGRESANVLTPLLKQAGFEVFEPTRAEQALEDGMRIRPDLVLLEQRLPDMDGLVALDRLRDQYLKAELSPPPFVMITDHDRPEDRNACLTAGAVDVLSKPLRFMDVLDVLQKQLHLEWTYGERKTAEPVLPLDEGELVMPPEPVLRQLLNYARAGDVRKLRDTAEYMRGQEPQLERFCRVILGLAANYQMNALVEFLQKHVKTTVRLSHD